MCMGGRSIPCNVYLKPQTQGQWSLKRKHLDMPFSFISFHFQTVSDTLHQQARVDI